MADVALIAVSTTAFLEKSPAVPRVSDIKPAESEPLTINELMRNRAALLGDLPLVFYPHTGIQYTAYTLRQLDVFAFRVAQKLAARIPPRRSSSQKPGVVSSLGPSDLNYLVTLLALSKLGHSVLLLSTRISLEAYASLLEKTASRHIVIHQSFRDTANDLRERIDGLQVHEIPRQDVYDYPIETNVDTVITPDLDPAVEANYASWIIHSSGSTGLPKPILQTQRAAVKNYAINMNMRGFITLPLYHNHGISCLFRSIYSCKTIHLYNASLPLTKQHLLNVMKAQDFEIFYGVPYALKLLAETDEGVEVLSKLKIVTFGGSPCPDSLGDKLVENGVHLISHYGSTETGQLMTSERPRDDKSWDYLRPLEAVKPFLRFEEQSPGIFELICLDGWPSKVVSNRPDGSYATRDLFLKHPTLEAYKYYARLDDTIVLINGEKVNPLEMEGTVQQDAAVSGAIAFGDSKAKIGLAIILSAAGAALSEDRIIDRIWPKVEKVQTAMPAYGQLSRDMIMVLPPVTQYSRTDKGTIIRQAFYRQFSQLIEDAYVEKIGDKVLTMSEPGLRSFLKEQIERILSPRACSALTEDVDFFNLGMDSLQATQLRTVLVKNVNTSGNKLGLNVAFDYPTINSLARHLYLLRSGTNISSESVEDTMQSLITKYGQFHQHESLPNGLGGRYIVITGATGSLGSHIAAKLSSQTDVQKIYCLIRAGSPIDAYDRLIKSMRERRVYDTLPNSARNKLIALPAYFAHSTLGLKSQIYNMITSEITDLVHCAWSVNFNLHLTSFEKDNIAGLKNLIDLCLKSQRPAPASFNFCSSVSTVTNTEGSEILEALPERLNYAQLMGYAQSKLVAENICLKAAEQTGIRARIHRIGQVVGDTRHGIWNATEAIPLLLQSAVTVGALPQLDESHRWLPVDVVADVVIDGSFSSKGSGFLNVVNDNTFHWTRDLLPLLHKAGLQFAELEQREWLRRLRASNPDPVVNPPIKLVEFFASKYDTGAPRRSYKWHTEEARRFSKALAEAQSLDQDLVNKMVGFFRKNWS